MRCFASTSCGYFYTCQKAHICLKLDTRGTLRFLKCFFVVDSAFSCVCSARYFRTILGSFWQASVKHCPEPVKQLIHSKLLRAHPVPLPQYEIALPFRILQACIWQHSFFPPSRDSRDWTKNTTCSAPCRPFPNGIVQRSSPIGSLTVAKSCRHKMIITRISEHSGCWSDMLHIAWHAHGMNAPGTSHETGACWAAFSS